MAINKNHEFEEMNGVKCSIVEKNVSPERTAFLKELLEWNKFTVVVVDSPPAKVAAVPKPAPDSTEGGAETNIPVPETPPPPPAPTTFTVGVTNVTFNAINAVFGRMLRTKENKVVSLAYWLQKESISNDDVPYYEKSLGKSS